MFPYFRSAAHVLRSWFAAPKRRPIRRQDNRARLRIEQLEDRLTPSTLGTTALLEGPAAGSDADIVASSGSWTASSNVSWLHTSASGTSNGLAAFTFDANPGATRTGTLTIAGQTLTVTQAGATAAAANPLESLVSSGLNTPFGVAVDSSGNVYIADFNDSAIKEWNAGTQLVTTLAGPAQGVSYPTSVAVDSAGNVYFTNTLVVNSVAEWHASNGQVTTPVSSGVSDPDGVAVDSADDVYIADTGNDAIKEWNSTTGVTTLASTGAGNGPTGIAVDAAGNVYFATYNSTTQSSTVKELVAGAPTTLISSMNRANGVAVDGSGNVYIADVGDSTIKVWNAATQQVAALASIDVQPYGVAVDAADNVYLANANGNAIQELVKAYVPTGPVTEYAPVGTDYLPAVLPTTQSLTGVYAPTSDQLWLALQPPSSGVIPFTFSTNPGPARTAHITLLGQQITITQQPALGTFNLVEGPDAGSDADIVVSGGTWTASSNASWLHTSSSGAEDGLATSTFDANTGPTRTGTLTINGATLTVTQAGSTYVAANALVTLDASGLRGPDGVAVDANGNVYIADNNNNAIDRWDPTTQQVNTLVSSGLTLPGGLAVDAAGNVYIADSGDNTVKEWVAATQQLTTLVSTGLSGPYAVAVDGAGNVYIADTFDNAIKEWVAATQQVITLVSSGLAIPEGVAVDQLGNVYIADTGHGAIKEWNATTQQVSTLVSSGLSDPADLAVDGSGNVYIADTHDNTLDEWQAATQQMTTRISSGLSLPWGVTVDGAGNIYIADAGDSAIDEIVNAFMPNAVSEPAATGSDALAPVLPTTQSLSGIYAPSSDQSWLTLGTISNGVINSSFSANISTSPPHLPHRRPRPASHRHASRQCAWHVQPGRRPGGGQRQRYRHRRHLDRNQPRVLAAHQCQRQRPGHLHLRRQPRRHAHRHPHHRRPDAERHPGQQHRCRRQSGGHARLHRPGCPV